MQFTSREKKGKEKKSVVVGKWTMHRESVFTITNSLCYNIVPFSTFHKSLDYLPIGVNIDKLLWICLNLY